MNNYRIEKDFLGEKKIPEDAFYGIQTLRALENFNVTGYRIHKSIIYGLAVVKKAAALANTDIGLLDKKIGHAIEFACDEIVFGKYTNQFLVDPIQGGAGTSINMNVNEVIANIALTKMGYKKGDYNIISPTNHVNMSQSTNDVLPTAGRIALIKMLNKLTPILKNLIDAFSMKSIEFDDVIKLGRTHLQDAIPIRLGQEFESYSLVINRDLNRINNSIQNLLVVNIGATAIGTGLNADNEYIKKTLSYLKNFTGYSLEAATNLVDATQNTDTYTEISSVLKICMTNLSKIANDLRLMASGPKTGFNEIYLPPRQLGSSIMPGKINPIMPELINQIAFQVIGNDLTISMASESGQLELNVFQPIIFFNLLQSITIMTNGISSFTEFCVKGIKANNDKLLEYVEKSIGTITAVNPHIGYENASRIANEALETDRTIRELCIKYGYLTQDELEIVLDPFEMTKSGISGKEILSKKLEDTTKN